MPELVEVETVKNVLAPQITGCTFDEIIINKEKIIQGISAGDFRLRLIGTSISNIKRRGKFLIFVLENRQKLICHFRMTGVMLVMPPEYEELKHTHIVFKLHDKTGSKKELRFIDQRQFGRFWLLEPGQSFAGTGIEKLGIEATDDSLSADYLRDRLSNRKIAIKTGLLDQHAIAGLGNIYTDEVLFRTKINPKKPCGLLTDEDWEYLASEIPRLMKFMIEKNKISREDYLKGRGIDYRNTPFLKVYNHAGEPCRVCGATLKREVINGRSTVFCPFCQPL